MMRKKVKKLTVLAIFASVLKLGKGAKIASVNFKKETWGTNKFKGAKPYSVKQNEANVTFLNRGVKFDH